MIGGRLAGADRGSATREQRRRRCAGIHPLVLVTVVVFVVAQVEVDFVRARAGLELVNGRVGRGALQVGGGFRLLAHFDMRSVPLKARMRQVLLKMGQLEILGGRATMGGRNGRAALGRGRGLSAIQFRSRIRSMMFV